MSGCSRASRPLPGMGKQWENGGCGRARSQITAWADARYYYRLAAPRGWQQDGGQLGHSPPAMS